MSKLIITTVGTSIIGNKLYPPGSETDIGLLSDGESISNTHIGQIIDGTTERILENLSNNHSNKFLSAEISSLRAFKAGIGLSSNDDVVALFSSDTEDGKFCARVNYEVLRKLNWCQVKEPKVIEGIRVKGKNISKSFKEEGLNHLRIAVQGLLSQGNFTEKYFNITGGFKSTIPLITLLAFENNMSLLYLYEESTEVIIIPPSESFLDAQGAIVTVDFDVEELGGIGR